MAELFGFEIKKKQQELASDTAISFAPELKDDGAVVVAEGGAYGTYVDLDGTVKTEAELVSKYREMSLVHEVDAAIDDVVNESIVSEPEEEIVSIQLDSLELPKRIKDVIRDEFNAALDLLEFKQNSYDIFRKWYIDGRLYYHAIVDEKNPQAGILELRYIDPRKIRKVREVKKQRAQPGTPVPTVKTKAEYFIYNERGFNNNAAATSSTAGASGLKIAKDSIVHCTSGLTDKNGTMVISYLHKAIKPLNQLRALEDATVIYRISRAPERRVFYIDVGNLPKMKAEQYLRDVMTRFKNKLVYNADTGEIKDDRKFMTMLEDFWLPRREGGKGTEITTLPAGQNLGELEDVKYFQRRLYKALNVPITRLESDSQFQLGRSNEISRDEVKFTKFINRLRSRFSHLFLKVLEKQLILKNIVTPEEWPSIAQNISFDFARDSQFAELKDIEILRERAGILRDLDDYVGKYYSHEWVRKSVLRFNENEIEEMDDQISKERDSGLYDQPVDPNAQATQGLPPQSNTLPENTL